MQYLGGKSKIAKVLVPYLEKQRDKEQVFIEPFVGGANIVSKMGGVRYAYDFNEYLMEMYKGVQGGYELPTIITEEQYKYIKSNKDEDKVLTGFVGFGCSFAGKWFGGYARNAQNKNYCLTSKNSLLKKMSTMNNFIFELKNYLDLYPISALIYCDPPYKNTTQYNISKNFDYEKFWAKIREWSKDNIVLVSELIAPDDFEVVWQQEVSRSLNASGKTKAIEKLFRYKG